MKSEEWRWLIYGWSCSGNLKRDIEALRAELKRNMKALELRLTIKLGAMLAVTVGAVTTLVKLL